MIVERPRGIFARFGHEARQETPAKASEAAHDAVYEPRKRAEEFVARGALPALESVYAYGVADGQTGIEKQYFESYIEHAVAEEPLARRLAELEERERALTAQEQEVIQLHAQLAAAVRESTSLRSSLEKDSERLVQAEQQLGRFESAEKPSGQQGSVTMGVVYCLAGLLFILGDVVMSHETVANALELTASIGPIDEGWVFAVGLAAISILLKPAYERVVEDAYWRNRPGRFGWTIGVAAVLAIVTLFVLGTFRSVAHVTDVQVGTITGAQGLSDAEQLAQIQQIRQGLLASPWATGAFVLTTILFAIAGAICLGIGLRHFQDFYHLRRKPGSARKHAEQEIREIRERVRGLESKVTEREADIERIRSRIGDLPELEHLRQMLAAARDQWTELHREFVRVRSEMLRSLYRDGYEFGAHAPPPPVPRRRSARPYVAVRRAIRRMAFTS